MNQEKSQLRKRVESFLWRLAMATLVFATAFVAENVSALELSPAVTGILALMAGELSKYINSKGV